MTGRIALLWFNRKVSSASVVVHTVTLSGRRMEGPVHLRSSCNCIRAGCVVSAVADQWGHVCFDHWCTTGSDVSCRDESSWTGVATLAVDW